MATAMLQKEPGVGSRKDKGMATRRAVDATQLQCHLCPMQSFQKSAKQMKSKAQLDF